MESSIPTLYIYSRVSTIKQTLHNKTGLQRQNHSSSINDTLNKFQGFPIVKLNDAGLSAMKGDNIDKGELGVFIDLCLDGKIAKGSVLAMEQLDRFTRLDLSLATSYMNNLLIHGVSIYTWADNVLYKKDDVYDAILAILQLKGANEYSKKLSLRVKGSAQVTIDKIKNNDRDADGYCKALKGYGTNKFWVDVASGYVRPHPYYFPIIREMLDMVLQGDGYFKIKKHLDENYDPPTKAKNASKSGWGVNIVKVFLLDDALIGQKEVNLNGELHQLENYYPTVCTVNELLRARKIRHEQKCFQNPVKKHFGLITGMRIAHCGDCGSSIQVFKSKANSQYESLRYKCSGRTDGSARNCKCSTIDSRYFETVLVKLIGSLVYQKKPEVDSGKVYFLENEIARKNKEKENYLDVIGDAGASAKYILERINKVQIELDVLAENLRNEKRFEYASIDKSIFKDIPNAIVNYENNEIRKEFRDKLHELVESIEVNAMEDCFMIEVTLVDGTKRRGVLLNLRYYFDLGFDGIHNLDNTDEFLAYADMQHNWFGVDKHDRKIEIKDIYWCETSTIRGLADLLALINKALKSAPSEKMLSALTQILKDILDIIDMHY
jgi:DNA invertase Pin-like site-specific DNA recombinase